MTVVGLLCMPVSVAEAVLRYRLWDLDRLISRTVTHLLVTGLLVLPYLPDRGADPGVAVAASLGQLGLEGGLRSAARPGRCCWSTSTGSRPTTTPSPPVGDALLAGWPPRRHRRPRR
jgi:hypothetical protein